jgi:hypothetical protein
MENKATETQKTALTFMVILSFVTLALGVVNTLRLVKRLRALNAPEPALPEV